MTNITIDDVELAVKIITAYLQSVNRAKIALQRIQSFVGSQSYSERDLIAKMVMEQMRFRTGTQETVEEESTLTDEDLEKFRKIADKFKKPQTEISTSP